MPIEMIDLSIAGKRTKMRSSSVRARPLTAEGPRCVRTNLRSTHSVSPYRRADAESYDVRVTWCSAPISRRTLSL
jgi:hypothetical protein